MVDRESGIGQGVSLRNSEVIHEGIYYTPELNIAALCVRGKALLYESDAMTELQASIVVNAASPHATHLERQFRGLAAAHIPQEHYANISYHSPAGGRRFDV